MAKFKLGKIAITSGADDAMVEVGANPAKFVIRHVTGDWGNLDAHDRAVNERAIVPDEDGEFDRVFSAYTLRNGAKIWVITESDRSRTTVLLPSEY